ncbi:MAG: sigma-70 factor domain-containing protein, partial [Acidobacteriota bacterium]
MKRVTHPMGWKMEDKYDGLTELINLGKEKGYLLFDEMKEMLRNDIDSLEDLDNIVNLFGDAGIEVINFEQQLDAIKQKIRPKRREDDRDEEPELTVQSLEKTSDPVRMYLREMGTVPLLTRQGEIKIAKRIEKGQRTVLKALSHSPVVVAE